MPRPWSAVFVLMTLLWLAGPAPTASGADAAEPTVRRGPQLTGTLTTEYLFDRQVSPSSTTTLNQLNEYLTLRWKNKTGPDLRVYFSGSYAYDLLDRSDISHRIYKLFAEWNDLDSLIMIRAGRQSGSGNTLFSRFDGATFTLRPSTLYSVSMAAGYPVQTGTSDRLGMQTDRWFYEVYVTAYDWHHIGGKLYYTQEAYGSFSTRQAVGLNGYWTNDDVNISAIADYDLDFARANNLLVNASYGWGVVRTFAGVNYRKNPFLDYAAALLDPNGCGAATMPTSFTDLINQLSRSAIQTCALSNTSDTLEFSSGVSVDLSSVWRADLRYAHTTGDVVVITGTAPVTLDHTTRNSDRMSLFLIERNGLHLAETWSLLLLFEPATDSRTASILSTLTKYWSSGAQGALRIRVDQLRYDASSTQTTRIAPGFVIGYIHSSSGVTGSIEADYAVEQSSGVPDTNTIQTRASLTIPF